jgi:hypothetical protein
MHPPVATSDPSSIKATNGLPRYVTPLALPIARFTHGSADVIVLLRCTDDTGYPSEAGMTNREQSSTVSLLPTRRDAIAGVSMGIGSLALCSGTMRSDSA